MSMEIDEAHLGLEMNSHMDDMEEVEMKEMLGGVFHSMSVSSSLQDSGQEKSLEWDNYDDTIGRDDDGNVTLAGEDCHQESEGFENVKLWDKQDLC